jgi:hypothetical protein
MTVLPANATAVWELGNPIPDVEKGWSSQLLKA